jgi:transcriptional regulator with XRE-family HTH domain
MLKPKHLAALELLKENKLSVREIAKCVGFSYEYLNDIMNASEHSGSVGLEFNAEYRKLEQVLDKRIRRNVKEALDLSSNTLKRWLQQLESKKKPTEKQIKLAKDIQMVLSKSRPNVEIGSFSYTKGLSAEDLFNEYKRLKGLAEQAIVRRRVSGLKQGRSGEVHLAPESGSSTEQGSEDTSLRTPPPSEEIPPEFLTD